MSALVFALAFVQAAATVPPPLVRIPTIQAPVVRTAPVQAPESEPARHAAGLSLVQLLFPLDRQQQQVDRAARTDIRTSLMKNAEFATMEAEMPGLMSAILDAMMPVVHKRLEQSLPAYHQGIAAIYARHMSVSELGDAYCFFNSPRGQSLVTRVNDNVSYSAIMDRALADPGAPVRRTDIDKTKNEAVERTVGTMSGAELAATAREVDGKSWVTRLPAVRRDISVYDEKFYNEPDPALDKQLDAAMERALADFLAKHEKSTRK